MRVLVCGGRDFSDRGLIFRTLDRLEPAVVINGAATGADSLSSEWAHAAQIQLMEYPAQWKRWGRRAGPIRNQRMLLEAKPDLVLAFRGGRGTADMIRQAREYGVEVRQVES